MVPQEIRRFFWTAVLVAICLFVGFFSIYVFNFGNNNWLEEMAEDVIKHSSGIDINISGEEEE